MYIYLTYQDSVSYWIFGLTLHRNSFAVYKVELSPFLDNPWLFLDFRHHLRFYAPLLEIEARGT